MHVDTLSIVVGALARGVSGCLLDTFCADFGHPNIHIFVHNAMEWKGIGHTIHPKFVCLDTLNSDILAKAWF